MHFRQCRLRTNETESCVTETTSWIPEKQAKVGSLVKLEGDKDIWRVTFVGERMKGGLVKERSRDYLHQRKVSDI
jgi:hypothetical protein